MQRLRFPGWTAPAIDWLIVAVLTAGAQIQIWFQPQDLSMPLRGSRVANAVLFLLMIVPLGWRRRAPLSVLAIVMGSTVVGFYALYDLASQVHPDPFLPFLLAIYSVAAHADRRRATIGGVLAAAAILAIDAPAMLAGAIPPNDVYGWFLYALAWILGRMLRRRQELAAALQDRAALLERDQEAKARTAVVDERARIARELHDVIAHSLSVIVVQAAAERRVLGQEHATTKEVLGSIEHTGRQALVELRRLLGVIRKTDDRPALRPQPTLAHLDELLAQVRDAGLAVQLHTQGEPVPLPAGVDLSAYRIVQEALTNVLKHAHASCVEVLVCYHPGELELEVTDDGQGQTDEPGGGHGLVGLGERVARYDGTLEAGQRDGGGYRLHACLRFEPVPA
jgi:signal transduction histidine kinase